jgi:membrane protease YdiL (CAAX protease family)
MSEAIRSPSLNALSAVFLATLAAFLSIGYFRSDLYEYSPALYWAFDTLKFVVIPAAALVFLARRYGIRPRDYGLRRPGEGESWTQLAVLTIFLALILMLAYQVSWYIALIVLRPDWMAPFYKDINATGLLRIPVTIYLAVTAGVAEEILFRALPLLYLERRLGSRLRAFHFVLGSALLFAAIHWRNGTHEVVATFAYGLLAAAVYYRLRDLLPLILAHVVIDLIEFA